MEEITPQHILVANAGYWAELNKLKLSAGMFTFKEHEYQIDIMSENHRMTCDMKATQGGFTENWVLKVLHGLIHRRYPQGVLYLFPTSDDVHEFSKSRFQPLISENHNAIGKFVQSTDTASLKRVGDAFLYLRGAKLTQRVKDEHKESTKLRSIPVDAVVYDEFDLMEEDVRKKAQSRMGHSKVKEEHWLSNPTIPDFGIDEIFKQSDQRHWFRKCRCGEYTSAEVSFPDCVKIRTDGTGYIGCNKCGKEVGIWPGEWIAAKPENKIVGRRWSQLTSVFNDPAEILEDYINPPQGNLGDVVRLRLGLPYISAEDKLSEADVFACCGDDMQKASFRGPCAMGVDVGKINHVIIGIRTGKNSYRILKTAKVAGWPPVHDLARNFNVKSAVIDIRPYEDSARTFQKSEPYKIWLCEYAESMPQGTIFNQNTGVVKVARTEILDATHRMVTQPGCLTIPRLSPEIKEFAKQLSSMAKRLEENKRTRLMVYRYITLGGRDDHYRHALNYFYLAADRGHIPVVSEHSYEKKKAGKCKNEYTRLR